MEAEAATLSRDRRAIVFTDVVDSTFRIEKSEERMVRLIRRDLAAIREIVAKNSGVIAKKTGDGVLALFPEVLQALSFAEQLREYMRDNMTKLPPDEVLKHKIGIHFGEVFVADEDAYGNEVNVAARITSSVPVGAIGVSAVAMNLLPGARRSGATSLGQLRLKGISELTEVWEFSDPDRTHPLIKEYDSRARFTKDAAATYDLPKRSKAPVILLILVAAVAGAYYGLPKERQELLAKFTPVAETPAVTKAPPKKAIPPAAGDKETPKTPSEKRKIDANLPTGTTEAAHLTKQVVLGKQKEFFARYDFAGFVNWLSGEAGSGNSEFATILALGQDLADLKDYLPGRIARIPVAEALAINTDSGPSKFYGDDTGAVEDSDGQVSALDLDSLRPQQWRKLVEALMAHPDTTAEDRAMLDRQIKAFNSSF